MSDAMSDAVSDAMSDAVSDAVSDDTSARLYGVWDARPFSNSSKDRSRDVNTVEDTQGPGSGPHMETSVR